MDLTQTERQCLAELIGLLDFAVLDLARRLTEISEDLAGIEKRLYPLDEEA